MYKADFRSKTFLRTENDVLDRIDYASYDEPEELRKYYSEIVTYDLSGLIGEIDRLEKITPYLKIHEAQKTVAIELLQVRLGLGFEFHYMIDMLSEQLQLIEKSFKEVEGLKNHRHKVGEGHYSEKPAW